VRSRVFYSRSEALDWLREKAIADAQWQPA
jgi:hypothetical protein